jgi:hypothetical protein
LTRGQKPPVIPLTQQQLTFWAEEKSNRLVWSFTRDRRLRACRRRYFYQYYASRDGDKDDASPEARQLYVLRTLRTRHMWVGEIVHELVEMALRGWRSGSFMPADALVERGSRRMRAQYAESVQGLYRQRPATACGLIEHEYHESISRDEWQALRDAMENSVRNFFDLPLCTTIQQTPTPRWLAIEAMGSFAFAGARVLAKPDFAFWNAEDRVALVDWKTGARTAVSADDQLQLAIYGLYARTSWAQAGEALVAHVAFLGSNQMATWEIDAAMIEQAQISLGESIETMRALAPAATADQVDLDQFPLTTDVTACARCGFRRVCGR